MKKTNARGRSFSLKDRYQYWFDNRISKSPFSLVRVLIAVSVIFAVLIALLIIVLKLSGDESNGAVIWNNVANVINAEVPSAEEGVSPGYIVLASLVAILGVLFTSVLIGLITSSIEEKVLDLKRGNSLVLEKDHTVVLGYYPGEYTLINQLILAAAGKPHCVVIGGNMERDEMEQDLKGNIENIPKNFRIICRKVDITDPSSIEKCSIDTCRTVIISPTDDFTTVKAVLTVSAYLKKKKLEGIIQVNAIVSRHESRLPASLTEEHNITTLETNSIIAKMVAHSCTQTGLSETFKEIFNFEGSEFYIVDMPETAGLTYEEVITRVNHAVPVGFFRGNDLMLNPPAEQVLCEGDQILVFAEENGAATLEAPVEKPTANYIPVGADFSEQQAEVVIFGYNETMQSVLRELPEHVNKVKLVGQELEKSIADKLNRIAEDRQFQLVLYPDKPETDEELFGIANYTEHIIILNSHGKNSEEADMDVISLLLRLRDIREQHNLHFNITVEMQKEHNQKLVQSEDHTDYLVSSSMASLILAQLAESPRLISVFREILSNRGSELYLKNVGDIRMSGTWSIRELRRIILQQGYIMLGYLDSDLVSHFNPEINEEIRLENDYWIIVLGEN